MRLVRMRLRFRSLGLALLSVAAAGVLLQIGPAQASFKKARRSTASATKQQALAAYGKLPLSFTANAGQADARVRYAAQGAGFSVNNPNVVAACGCGSSFQVKEETAEQAASV